MNQSQWRSFRDAVKDLRDDWFWTQKELAEEAGVSENTIRKIENNATRHCHRDTIDLLAKAFRLEDPVRAVFVSLGRGRKLPDESASAPTAPPVRQVVGHKMPLGQGQLFGREHELDRAFQGLGSTYTHIEIIGAPGTGKTTLATQIGYACLYGPQSPLADVFEAVVWLSASDRPEKKEWLADLHTAITDVLPLSQGASDIDVQRALGAIRTLIIIDNFETIEDPDLVAWLQRLPNPSKVMVTSCSAHLLSTDTWIVEMGGLEPEPALAMIRSRAQASALERIATCPDDDLRQLIEVTGGVPKAIEMSLGYLDEGIISLTGIVEALRAPSPAVDPAVEDLFTVLYDQAWKALTPQARLVFCALSLFSASAPKAAVAPVASISPREAERGLATLRKLCLIDRGEALEESELRYGLHPLSRAYARLKLQRGDLAIWAGDARERWIAWYLALIGRCAESGHAEMTTEDTNIAGVVDWLAEQAESSEAAGEWYVDACAQLQQYWRERWHMRDSLKYLPEAIHLARAPAAMSETPNDYAQAMVLMKAYGYMLVLSRSPSWSAEAPATFLLEMLAMAQAAQDKVGEQTACFSLAIVALIEGNLRQAGRYFNQNLEIRREVADPQEWALDIVTFRQIANSRKNIAQLKRYYEKALRIDAQTGNRRGAALAEYALGTIAFIQGRPAEAIQHLKAGVKGAQQLGHRFGEAVLIGTIGDCEVMLGLFEDAKKHFDQALLIFTQEHQLREAGMVHLSMGQLYLTTGDLSKVTLEFQTAHDLCVRANDISTEADVVYWQAELAAEEGRLDDAERLFRDSLMMRESIRNGPGIAHSQFALGRFLVERRGQLQRGRERIQEAITRYDAMGLEYEHSAREYAQRWDQLG